MAIATEFINFIVPIKTIRAKYPGGWEQCLIDHEHLIGGRVWYDEHLFRDGAMNVFDIEEVVKRWESKGFVGIVSTNNERYWQDMCVFTFGWTTEQCDWFDFDSEIRGAFLKGTDPGEVVSRASYNKGAI